MAQRGNIPMLILVIAYRNGMTRELKIHTQFMYKLTVQGHDTAITHLFQILFMIPHAGSEISSHQLFHSQWERIWDVIVSIGE